MNRANQIGADSNSNWGAKTSTDLGETSWLLNQHFDLSKPAASVNIDEQTKVKFFLLISLAAPSRLSRPLCSGAERDGRH